MRRFVLLVFAACTHSPESDAGIYQVSARTLATGGPCATTIGDPVDFAVPDRQIAVNPADPHQLGWAWCDSTMMCDSINDGFWYDPSGDHWLNIVARVENAPDNGIACDLQYNTLTIARHGSTLHVDVLERTTGGGDVNDCTTAAAIAMLANETWCYNIDRYDLALPALVPGG